MNTRPLVPGIGVLLLLTCSSPGMALSAEPAAQPGQVITVNFKDLPLHDALREVAAQTGIRVRIKQGVPNYRVSLNIRDIQTEPLLTLLLRQANSRLRNQGISYTREKAVYVFAFGPLDDAKEAPPPMPARGDEQFQQDPRLAQKLTFTVKNEPLELVIGRIFQGTGVQYQVLPALRKLPMSLAVQDVDASTVLRLTLRQVADKMPGARLRKEGQGYILGITKADNKASHQP